MSIGIVPKNIEDVNLKSLYNHSIIYQDINPIFNIDVDSVRWSYKRLKTLIECKRRYYYQYVMGLRERSDTVKL